LHVVSLVCEATLLAVTALAASADGSVSSANVRFLALSALATFTSFAVNLIGARRLVSTMRRALGAAVRRVSSKPKLERAHEGASRGVELTGVSSQPCQPPQHISAAQNSKQDHAAIGQPAVTVA
jgi:hypothetical protein